MTEMMDVLALKFSLFVMGALIGAGGLVGIAVTVAIGNQADILISKIRCKKSKGQEPDEVGKATRKYEGPYKIHYQSQASQIFSRDQERMDRKIGEKLGEVNQLLKKELCTENYAMVYVILHDVKDLIEARAFKRGYDRGKNIGGGQKNK